MRCVQKSEWLGCAGPRRHFKDSDFYSKCNGKLLEDFEQNDNTVVAKMPILLLLQLPLLLLLLLVTVSIMFSSVQFSAVTQSCPTLCNPMNRSTPGLPVHHKLPEFTQTHVHRVGDAIQPSHPLSFPSPPPQSLPASESYPMSQLFA